MVNLYKKSALKESAVCGGVRGTPTSLLITCSEGSTGATADSHKHCKDGSAETNYGKISDTEELLGTGLHESDSDDRLRTACTTPPIETDNTPNLTQQKPTDNPQQEHLNLEQFSCDVSMEGGVDRKGQERQEFSFTLYDFDGYGKITKDDIAGLVTTIYEALGSSVKVPHYGSKTIRVKLTVSPDQRKHVSATVINEKKNPEEKSEPSTRLKRDLNVTIRHGNKHCRKSRKKPAEQRRHHCCESTEADQEDCLNVSDDSSDISSNLSGDVTSEEDGDCSDHYICNKMRQKKYRKKMRKYTHKENIGNQQEGCSKTEKGQKRSSSLQRQELLEIIQANMDKNNLGLQSTRKQTNILENKTAKNETTVKAHQKRAKSTNMPTLQYLANIMDPTHFYVDLASFQNATQLPNTDCQYNKLIDAVMCVSSKKVPVKRSPGCRKHNKIKTHDYTNASPRCNILTDSTQNNEKSPKLTKTEIEQTKQFKKNVKKVPQIVLGNTSSPHYLRHRNRQEDQARAMAQVVRWLEQEFSSNFYTNDQNHKTEHRSNSYEKQTNNGTPSASSSVERHEHHHVHEHIHHHYHHYQDTPIVV